MDVELIGNCSSAENGVREKGDLKMTEISDLGNLRISVALIVALLNKNRE